MGSDIKGTPLEVAEAFVLGLYWRPGARDNFIKDNFGLMTWLRSAPCDNKPVLFWTYGPPIPGADGLTLYTCSVWYSDGWRYNFFGDKVTAAHDCDSYDDVKKIVEAIARQRWADAETKPERVLTVKDFYWKRDGNFKHSEKWDYGIVDGTSFFPFGHVILEGSQYRGTTHYPHKSELFYTFDEAEYMIESEIEEAISKYCKEPDSNA